MYGSIILVTITITIVMLRYFKGYTKKIEPLAVTFALAGFSILFVKIFYSGLYMKSAVGLICCLGILVGTELSKYREVG